MKKNLCNDSVDCRIFSYEGNDYEQPPTAMVAGGILSVLYGKVEKNEELYVMPDNLKNYFKRRNFIMKTMFIYEPAMCCESGLCGVGIDPELLRISTVISNLKKQGIKVDRYNLNNFPQEFVKNQDINRLINGDGVDSLPATILDGKIVKTKKYPTNDEISSWFGIPKSSFAEDQKSSGGCGCEGGCC